MKKEKTFFEEMKISASFNLHKEIKTEELVKNTNVETKK